MTPKQKRAIELRDAALACIRHYGCEFAELPGMREKIIKAKFDQFTVLLDTPFTGVRRSVNTPEITKIWAKYGVAPGVLLDGGLDIYHADYKGKLANIEWDEQGNVEIRSFKRGPWEDELLRLASAAK